MRLSQNCLRVAPAVNFELPIDRDDASVFRRDRANFLLRPTDMQRSRVPVIERLVVDEIEGFQSALLLVTVESALIEGMSFLDSSRR